MGALQQLGGRLAGLVVRGAVAVVHAAGRQQRLQIRLLAGEPKDNVEHFEPYGFTSHALPGAEHLTLALDGDRSHCVTVIVNDRRYRLQGLPAGGVALYDASGSYVQLTNDGHIRTSGTWEHTGSLRVSEDIVADGDVADQGGLKTMAAMRTAHDTHTGHHYPGGTPDVLMS